MTDYNDGKWHGWSGGKCPVHPKSVVEREFFRLVSSARATVNAIKAARKAS